MPSLYYDIFETPEGWMGALASTKGLKKTTLPALTPDFCAEQLQPDLSIAAESPERCRNLRLTIIMFLAGNKGDFSKELLDFGASTPFLRAVWEACTTIPNGQTRSYTVSYTHLTLPTSDLV